MRLNDKIEQFYTKLEIGENLDIDAYARSFGSPFDSLLPLEVLVADSLLPHDEETKIEQVGPSFYQLMEELNQFDEDKDIINLLPLVYLLFNYKLDYEDKALRRELISNTEAGIFLKIYTHANDDKYLTHLDKSVKDFKWPSDEDGCSDSFSLRFSKLKEFLLNSSFGIVAEKSNFHFSESLKNVMLDLLEGSYSSSYGNKKESKFKKIFDSFSYNKKKADILFYAGHFEEANEIYKKLVKIFDRNIKYDTGDLPLPDFLAGLTDNVEGRTSSLFEQEDVPFYKPFFLSSENEMGNEVIPFKRVLEERKFYLFTNYALSMLSEAQVQRGKKRKDLISSAINLINEENNSSIASTVIASLGHILNKDYTTARSILSYAGEGQSEYVELSPESGANAEILLAFLTGEKDKLADANFFLPLYDIQEKVLSFGNYLNKKTLYKLVNNLDFRDLLSDFGLFNSFYQELFKK